MSFDLSFVKSQKGLKIVHWNVRSLMQNFDEFDETLLVALLMLYFVVRPGSTTGSQIVLLQTRDITVLAWIGRPKDRLESQKLVVAFVFSSKKK